MSTVELDPDFAKGLRLMFSSSNDSTEMLRALLEDAIRAKHGTSRSLGNIPTNKDDDEMCIVLERNSDDSASEKDEDDDEISALEMMEEDLSCSICKDLSIAPGNRLIECCECHELYHQECHKPSICDKEVDDPRHTWYCSSCKQVTAEAVKQTSSKTISTSSSSSPSKSLRSSPSLSRESPTNIKPTEKQGKSESSSLFKRTEKLLSGNSSSSSQSSSSSKPSGLAAMAASLQTTKSSSSSSTKSSLSALSKGTASPSKSGSSTFSSSSSSKTSGTSGSSSSSSKISSFSGVPSPTSSSAADKRLQNMKKKAATKLQEKRKHSK